MNSYLTEAEIDALQSSKLSRSTPFLIQGVSNSYLSVARHYGTANYNGSRYTYLPETDELIRNDVLKWVRKFRKGAKKAKGTVGE